MGRRLVDSLPSARELYDRAAEVLGYDLAGLCFEGPPERLDSTVYSQPALFVTSLAALEVLRSQSPDVVEACTATAGLSLGEYTSLVFAGVMGFEDGLRLVQQRGAAMQAAADVVPSGMVSILGLDRGVVQELCDKARNGATLQMANYLCPGNVAISGEKAACARAVTLAAEMGAMRAVPLSVAGAFHTPIMRPAIERLRAALTDVKMRPPRIPVVSNVDAQPHDDPEEIRALLARQVVEPVLWEDSMRTLMDQTGIEKFYEIGPGRVLRGLLRRIKRKVVCENIEA
jgi:[acyl-carrier-protein] S-malonyltransferase